MLSLLSACDSSAPPATVTPAAPAAQQPQVPAPAVDREALAKRYAGRELEVVDVSEVQLLSLIHI